MVRHHCSLNFLPDLLTPLYYIFLFKLWNIRLITPRLMGTETENSGMSVAASVGEARRREDAYAAPASTRASRSGLSCERRHRPWELRERRRDRLEPVHFRTSGPRQPGRPRSRHWTS